MTPAGVCMREIRCVLILWLGLAGVSGFANTVFATPDSAPASAPTASLSSNVPVDPNKAPSEFNHHMAGWALIGVGVLVLAGFLSPQLRPLRYLWPALFVLAGVFLALWSDAEIWPRGNLSWAWLLHHDQEARQHKIYALLLFAIGIVEYLRARGSLNRFWRTWAFPILAVIGAAFLLVHDHTAASGANSPEARAFLVNPALDPDGHMPAVIASSPAPAMDHSMIGMDMDQYDSTMSPGAMSHADMDHSDMDHSSLPITDSSAGNPSPAHHHHMTPSMLLVEHEHFWFMVVGLTVALFKLISDSEFFRRRFASYAWPSGMMILGVLLVLYRE
jgi:hypothetical protein